MAYLKFNKAELVNLEYSLKREMLATNSVGGYVNTTIVCCNTRKYHGLFTVPIMRYGGHRYILLSALDETLFQHGKPFNLGIHCYGDIFEPRGHKYIVDFEMDPVPTVTYSVGGMLFRKEILLVRSSEELLIRYTLLEAHSDTTLRLKPFLAFRGIHELTRANNEANTRFRGIENGAAFCMYEGFPDLNIQISKKAEYVHCPDWYRNVVYSEEYRRGFDCSEDLFVPGFFEMPIAKGESIVVSASTKCISPARLKAQFTREEGSVEPRTDYDSCLRAAAKDLIAFNQLGSLCVCTGFSWHEIGGFRETCLALPGLTIYNDGNVKLFEQILSDFIKENREFLVKSSNQVEVPFRLTELLQHYISFTGEGAKVWKKYGQLLKEIVRSHIEGRPEIHLDTATGLLWAEKPGTALSWMNAYVGGRPVTERRGFQVETNSYWYNALRFIIDMERAFGKSDSFTEKCISITKDIEASFHRIFWVEARRHLADYVDESGQNVFTRPNQIYACSLPYSPVSEDVQADVLNAVKRELLTARGIRTLSPKNPYYRSHYNGNQVERDTATHNGCNRPWLLGPFAEAEFKLRGAAFCRHAQDMVDGFEEDMNVHGIGAVAEIYDGDPIYMPHGAVNSAMSVAEILRVKYMINKYKEEEI